MGDHIQNTSSSISLIFVNLTKMQNKFNWPNGLFLLFLMFSRIIVDCKARFSQSLKGFRQKVEHFKIDWLMA